MLARLDASPEARAFAQLEDCGELIRRGPLTPDHSLHAKPFGAVFDEDPLPGLREFEQEYLRYFHDHAGEHHQCLDAASRYGTWRGNGMVYLAPNYKRLEIVADISAHTIRAIRLAEAIGGWRALPREKLFEVEYWELEQAQARQGSLRAGTARQDHPGYRRSLGYRPRHGRGNAQPRSSRDCVGHSGNGGFGVARGVVSAL